MDNAEAVSPKLLRKLLRYEPETGKLFWRERSVCHFDDANRRASWKCNNWNSIYSDKEAGTTLDTGYRNIHIGGSLIRGHRIVWAMYHGQSLEVRYEN